MAVDNADCAFILVNYNTGEYLFDLLDSLEEKKKTEPSFLPFTYHVVVVDNNSADGSAERLEERAGVRLIRNGENLGYAKAVNIGIEACRDKYRYLCVLNADVKLDEHTWSSLWDFMEANPKARICAPVIYSSNGKVQGFFFKFNPLLLHMDFLKAAYSSYMKMVIGRLKKPLAVDGVAGTFLFFRSGLVKPGEKKLFNEDYFFYFEDADLALRLKKSGIKTYIVPGSRVVHFGSPTAVEFHWRLFYRNKYLFLEKNYGRFHVRLARAMDRRKVRSKLLKYALLKRVYPSKRVLAKFGHYREIALRFEEIK